MYFTLYFALLAAIFSGCETDEFRGALEGEAFVVDCTLSSVTWYLGDDIISMDKEKRIHSSECQLWFLPALREDSGNYTCVDSEHASSEIISVTIYPHKEGICYDENILYEDAKGSLGSGMIPCPSFDNYKNASNLKWYKDCKELHGSKYVFGKQLFIKDANENDTGKYTCEFTYKHGNRTFNVSATRSFKIKEQRVRTRLTVLYPKDNEVIEVQIGSSQNLSCKAVVGEGADILATSRWEYTGEKDPKCFENFSWTSVIRSSRYMEPPKRQVIEAILQIKEVREEDFGLNFTCFMANDMEYKRVSVTLRKAPSTEKNNSGE